MTQTIITGFENEVSIKAKLEEGREHFDTEEGKQKEGKEWEHSTPCSQIHLKYSSALELLLFSTPAELITF